MNNAILVFGGGVTYILALIGFVFLIFPPHTTTADQWLQGKAACEPNGGADGARRHYDSLVVTCANGASFTIKIKG
jgi:hypothetical protein